MMKRLLTLLLWALPAFAQSPVIVTGTVQAPDGTLAASGKVTFTITPSSQAIQYFINGTTIVAPTLGTCAILNGNIVNQAIPTNPCTVWGNDVITPANTLYKISYYPNGILSTTASNILIVGTGPYNLNAPTFSPTVNITPQFGTVPASPINSNLMPAANNVFNVGAPGKQYANGYFNNVFAASTVNTPLFIMPLVNQPSNLPPAGFIYVFGSLTTGLFSCINSVGTSCAPSGGPGGGVTNFATNITTIAPFFNVSVTTPTTTPVLNFFVNSQAANCIFAGPASGVPAVPTCRTLVTADIPPINLVGGVFGNLPVNNLAGGVGASSSTVWCGNGTWCTPPAGNLWGGFAFPLTGPAQMIVSGAGGAPAALVPPITPNSIPEFLISVPSGGVGTQPFWSVSGVTNRNVNGIGSDIPVGTDCSNRINYNGTIAVAVTLNTPTVLGVPKCIIKMANNTSPASTVTITPNGGFTINGGVNLPLAAGQTAVITVDAAGNSWDADVQGGSALLSGLVSTNPAIAQSSTNVVTVPISYDATLQTTGIDMCDKINKSRAQALLASAQGAVIDARGFIGTQNVATNCWANYPSGNAYNETILFPTSAKLVTSVTQIMLGGVDAEGNSTHGQAAPTNTDGGFTIQMANTFPASTPLIQYGTAANQTGTWMSKMRVNCLPPSGTFIIGSIGIQVKWAQENSGGDHLFVDGCETGFDIETTNSQNNGDWSKINISMNGVTDNTARCIVYGSTASGAGPNRGFHGLTCGGGADSVEPTALIQVDGSNITFDDVHCEQGIDCFLLGANHGAHGLVFKGINCTSTATYIMTNCVHNSSAVGGDSYAILGVFGDLTHVTNWLKDDLTNGGTIAVGNTGTLETGIGFFSRGPGNRILSNSSQIPTTLAVFTFANLPTYPNGSQVYCSDCNTTCTAGSLTGRTCFRENGAWTH